MLHKLIATLNKLPEFTPNPEDKNQNWTTETEVGIFLHSLIKMTGAKNVLEIGMFRGYTSCIMADAVKNSGCYTGIDIEDRISPEVYSILDKYNTNIKVGVKSTDFLNDILSAEFLDANGHNPTYDLAFVDGNHSGDYVMREFKLLERVMKPGSLICYHDSMHKDIPGVKKLVEFIRTHKWFEVVNLPTPDNRGLAIVKCNWGL